MKWKEHVPAKNALLWAIKNESRKIKAKSCIIDKFAGKELHEIFEQYVNAELKAIIVEKTNRYAAQKRNIALFTKADLETFNAVLMLTGYHNLPRTHMFWEKEDDIGLTIVYELISGREFEELKRFIHFADNYSLNTNDKFAKGRQLYNITNKNLKQFFFFIRTIQLMNRWCLTRVTAAVNKLFKQRQFTLVTKSLSFALMMVILILLIHPVVLSTVVEKRLNILLLGR